MKGHVYPDGSLLDGIAPELARTGWACVVMSDDGEVIAAAYGVPPPWVKGIEGEEAWALHQGSGFTIPDECEYWPDCLPVKKRNGQRTGNSGGSQEHAGAGSLDALLCLL